jgi:hypothetical protein
VSVTHAPYGQRTAIVASISGAMFAVALIALAAGVGSLVKPPRGEEIPLWAIALWLSPVHLASGCAAVVPAWTVLMRTRRHIVTLPVAGLISALLIDVGIAVGFRNAEMFTHTTRGAAAMLDLARPSIVVFDLPVALIAWSLGGILAGAVARRLATTPAHLLETDRSAEPDLGSRERRVPERRRSSLLGFGWLVVVTPIAAGLVASRLPGVGPSSADLAACETVLLPELLTRGDADVTLRVTTGGTSDKESRHQRFRQTVWVDSEAREVRFQGVPSDPAAAYTGRGGLADAIDLDIGLMSSPSDPAIRTTRCSGMPRFRLNEPWHVVALAVSGREANGDLEPPSQLLPLRSEEAYPDDAASVRWEGGGARAVVWLAKLSRLPLAADIALSNATWRIDWDYDSVVQVPTETVHTQLFEAGSDVTVVRHEQHYWTMEEVRAFTRYPVFFAGPSLEGYPVRFMRTLRHDVAESDERTAACVDEDNVSVLYMRGFNEAAQGRQLYLTVWPDSDCARQRTASAGRSNGDVHVLERTGVIIELRGPQWTTAELVEIAQTLEPVNPSALR